jgi:hypothetical protein
VGISKISLGFGLLEKQETLMPKAKNIYPYGRSWYKEHVGFRQHSFSTKDVTKNSGKDAERR